MKILMVFTSHDQLGNTGRPTGFWLKKVPRLISSSATRCRLDACFAKGRAASSRSKKRSARESDTRDGAIQKG